MTLTGGSRSIREKPVQLSDCPPNVQRRISWDDRARAAWREIRETLLSKVATFCASGWNLSGSQFVMAVVTAVCLQPSN